MKYHHSRGDRCTPSSWGSRTTPSAAGARDGTGVGEGAGEGVSVAATVGVGDGVETAEGSGESLGPPPHAAKTRANITAASNKGTEPTTRDGRIYLSYYGNGPAVAA